MIKQIISSSNLFRDWLLENNEPYNQIQTDNNFRPVFYFILCVVFYCLFQIITQQVWVLGGEMWAEMATNYFSNANAPSIAIKLFATDAGYIPLPQRMIAYVGNVLGLPASVIPYFYTWSAILITGGMVGTICLKPFRTLVRSDLLRFLAAIAVLLIADFETRTFINFTYFVGFFVAIVTALSFVEKSNDIPWWAWLIPILMISKPAVLSALPAMIMVAFFSKTRFRLITIVTTLFCVAQIIRMLFSHSTGTFESINEFSAIEKLYSAVKYFVGFLGAYLVGKTTQLIGFYRPILFGLGFLIFCIFTLFKKNRNASVLILVGLSLVFFNVLINSFALSDSWNTNMERLDKVRLYRHTIVGYFGVVLIVVGLIVSYSDNWVSKSRSWKIKSGPSIFCLWFILSGWVFYFNINKAPRSPAIYNSHWQAMSNAIDSGQATCVPLDPFGWIFQRNCFQLDPDIDTNNLQNKLGVWTKKLSFEPVETVGRESSISIAPPSLSLSKNLISIAVLIKPYAEQLILINARVVLKMKNGNTKYLVGSRQLSVTGGLLMLTGGGVIPISEIEAVTLKFSAPVDLAFVPIESRNKPVVFWMGN
jgi:hypothetical protein